MNIYKLSVFLNERFHNYSCVVQYNIFSFKPTIEFKGVFTREVYYTLILNDDSEERPYLELRDNNNNVLTRIFYNPSTIYDFEENL